MARIYGEIGDSDDALKRVKRYERLLSFNPEHPESHIALAETALDAELWGEARNHLERAAGDDPSARVCRMMADLEERSGENPESARSWLLRVGCANRPGVDLPRLRRCVGQLVAGLWGLRIAWFAKLGTPGPAPGVRPASTRHRTATGSAGRRGRR